MPTGGYYYELYGLEDVVSALRESRGGLRDLRAAYKRIADDAFADVARRVPYGRTSPKDSKQHLSAGYLRSTLTASSTIRGPWVRIGDQRTPYVIVQEFGGKSYWHRAGAGAFRSLNSAHRAVNDLGDGEIGWEAEYSSRGRRAARGMSRSVRTKGHIVYEKPRRRRGYFIWNVAWRLKEQIGYELHVEMANLCKKHGIWYEMPANTDIGIEQQDWRGAAA